MVGRKVRGRCSQVGRPGRPVLAAACALAVAVGVLAAGTSAADEVAPTPGRAPYDPAVLLVDLLQNGDFESVADSTTEPMKYGAHWRGAFVPKEGDPTDRVVERDDGGHALRLVPGEGPVSQIVTPYGPFSGRLLLTLAVRPLEEGAGLLLTFTTQEGRRLRYLVGAEPGEVPGEGGGTLLRVPLPAGEDGWHVLRLALGADLERQTGRPPEPWSRLALEAVGGPLLVDDVVVPHVLPRVAASALRASLLADVRDILRLYLAPPGGQPLAGLGLVNGKTGYLVGTAYDVETGEIVQRTNVGGISGIHGLMVAWLQAGDDSAGGRELEPLVRDRLRKHITSVLRNNVFGPTDLYCLYDFVAQRPLLQPELSPSHFIEYAFDVSELFPGDEQLRRYVEVICGEMADAMVRLRDEHDLPPEVPFGRGPGGNWFGRMPEKVSPRGILSEPLKQTYDQAWAIASNRSWYHDCDTLVGLMRVWAVDPKPAYRDAVGHVLQRFDRAWDAARYDMENDTDDHYGKNVEAALTACRHSGWQLPELLAFAQAATDHRLPRDAPWDRNLWVEGIRLGSFTTGDQPRAFRGPQWLYTAPPEANPETAGWVPYRRVLRELCKSDLRRRILDDGHLTEASSWQWEMIAACFQGDYIAPCHEREQWEGDMGDLFAGPSTNAFRALGRTIDISHPGERAEFLAWYALVHEHTQAVYRRPFGYTHGLPVETGRRYDIPERYLQGWLPRAPNGFATFNIHGQTLATLDLRDLEQPLGLTVVREGGQLRAEVQGPPGRAVQVRAGADVRPHHAGVTDWRVLHADPRTALGAAAVLDGEGHAVVELGPLPEAGPVAVDVVLPLLDAEGIEEVASGVW